MLESVEILDRRSLRRRVHVPCEIVSTFWDDPVPHVATNLSEHGVFVQSLFPLTAGEHVFLSFRPPRWEGEEILVGAVVRRVEMLRRASDQKRCGMGFEFLDLTKAERVSLSAKLRGLPPPLPRGPSKRFDKDMVWVDRLLTWEEDLGDRVNVFEVSEAIGPIADDDFEIEIAEAV